MGNTKSIFTSETHTCSKKAHTYAAAFTSIAFVWVPPISLTITTYWQIQFFRQQSWWRGYSDCLKYRWLKHLQVVQLVMCFCCNGRNDAMLYRQHTDFGYKGRCGHSMSKSSRKILSLSVCSNPMYLERSGRTFITITILLLVWKFHRKHVLYMVWISICLYMI